MNNLDTTPRRAPASVNPLALLGDLSAVGGFSSIRARQLLEEHITACMGILDAMEGDCDFEPTMGSLEHHPNCFGYGYCDQSGWGNSDLDDREPSIGGNDAELDLAEMG